MVVTVKITVFWDVTSWSLVDRYQCFRGICCFHLQSALNIYVPCEIHDYVGSHISVIEICTPTFSVVEDHRNS
jgi:hypothetical protein